MSTVGKVYLHAFCNWIHSKMAEYSVDLLESEVAMVTVKCCLALADTSRSLLLSS